MKQELKEYLYKLRYYLQQSNIKKPKNQALATQAFWDGLDDVAKKNIENTKNYSKVKKTTK